MLLSPRDDATFAALGDAFYKTSQASDPVVCKMKRIAREADSYCPLPQLPGQLESEQYCCGSLWPLLALLTGLVLIVFGCLIIYLLWRPAPPLALTSLDYGIISTSAIDPGFPLTLLVNGQMTVLSYNATQLATPNPSYSITSQPSKFNINGAIGNPIATLVWTPVVSAQGTIHTLAGTASAAVVLNYTDAAFLDFTYSIIWTPDPFFTAASSFTVISTTIITVVTSAEPPFLTFSLPFILSLTPADIPAGSVGIAAVISATPSTPGPGEVRWGTRGVTISAKEQCATCVA